MAKRYDDEIAQLRKMSKRELEKVKRESAAALQAQVTKVADLQVRIAENVEAQQMYHKGEAALQQQISRQAEETLKWHADELHRHQAMIEQLRADAAEREKELERTWEERLQTQLLRIQAQLKTAQQAQMEVHDELVAAREAAAQNSEKAAADVATAAQLRSEVSELQEQLQMAHRAHEDSLTELEQARAGQEHAAADARKHIEARVKQEHVAQELSHQLASRGVELQSMELALGQAWASAANVEQSRAKLQSAEQKRRDQSTGEAVSHEETRRKLAKAREEITALRLDCEDNKIAEVSERTYIQLSAHHTHIVHACRHGYFVLRTYFT